MLLDLFSNPTDALLSLLVSLPGIFLALSAHEAAHGWMAYKCGDPTAKMMGRITLNPLKHLDPVGFLCMLFAGFGWARPVPVNPNNFRNYRRDDLKVSLAGITANLILFVIGFMLIAGTVTYAYASLPEFDSMDAYIEYLDQNDLTSEDGVARENINAVWKDDGDTLVALIPAGENAYAAGNLGAKTVYYTFMPERIFSDSSMSAGYFLVSNLWGKTGEIAFQMLLSFVFLNLALAAFNLIPLPPLDGYHVLNDLVLKRPLFADYKAQRTGSGILFALIILGNFSPRLDVISIAINFVRTNIMGAFTSLWQMLLGVFNII
ncbi:MAG: site-2 protease family protein [Clostridia bacterium]|nr:site-2 protease family protein [Clostridia bacterium]